MEGKIIAFRNCRGAGGTRQVRHEVVPNGPDRHAQLRLHLARISALLRELEALKHVADSLPAPLAAQARATIDKARSVVGPESARADDGDHQPDIDRALLERMYRDLNSFL